MAFTQSDLTAIDQAIVRIGVAGVATVTVAGQTVTAKSIDELRKLRELVCGELSAAADGPGFRLRTITPVYR